MYNYKNLNYYNKININLFRNMFKLNYEFYFLNITNNDKYTIF